MIFLDLSSISNSYLSNQKETDYLNKKPSYKYEGFLLLWEKVSNLHEAVSYSTKFGGRPRSN